LELKFDFPLSSSTFTLSFENQLRSIPSPQVLISPVRILPQTLGNISDSLLPTEEAAEDTLKVGGALIFDYKFKTTDE
jgi:hypothetical protein